MISLAKKDIQHSFGKFIVTAIGVGMLLGIVLLMIGVYRGMISDSTSLTHSVNADVWVVQENTLGPFAESSKLFENNDKALKAIPGVEDASGLTFQTIQIPNKNGKEIRVQAVGYEVGGLGEPKVIEGTPLLKKQYEIVVDQSLGYSLGDKINIGNDAFTVVGITKDIVASDGGPTVFVSLDDGQKFQFLESNHTIHNNRKRGIQDGENTYVNTVVIKAKPNANIEQITEDIQQWNHKAAYSNQEQENILSKNVIEAASKQIGLFTAILIVVSAVIISLIIYTMTIGKIKEIAILKLIGVPSLKIVGMIIQESIVLGILSFLSGWIFAHLIQGKFPKNVILLNKDAIFIFVVVIIVSIIGSMFGVRKALKADPREAIGG